MRTGLAVVVAFILLLVGWLSLAVLLYGVGYVGSQAREGIRPIQLLNAIVMWVAGPGFGGFLATYVTPRIFRKVSAATIAASFISVIITLCILTAILSVIFIKRGDLSITDIVLPLAQFGAIIFGSAIGNRMYAADIP